MNNYEVIGNFIVENFLFGDNSEFNDETDIFKASIVDSTGVLELVSFIEDYYKIVVQDDELIQENFCSVNSIKAFLKQKLMISTN